MLLTFKSQSSVHTEQHLCRQEHTTTYYNLQLKIKLDTVKPRMEAPGFYQYTPSHRFFDSLP